MAGRLCDRDHELMDKFLEHVFEEVRSRSMGKAAFIEAIAFIVTAIDIGEQGEALRCFEEGVKEPTGRLGIVM